MTEPLPKQYHRCLSLLFPLADTPPVQARANRAGTGARGGYTLAVLLLLTLISGCTQEDSLQYRYQDYIGRLENVLEQDAAPPEPLAAIAYPGRRERLNEIERFEQGLVEVWDFRRCQLMHLINQRNSNLGKVLRPSQRYLYENHFWQKLQPCYRKRQQWQQEDPDFVQRLEASYRHKQKIQPAVVHQLFFSADELQKQLSQNQPVFPPTARPEYRSVADALQYLARLKQAPFDTYVPASELEQQLQTLHRQPILHSLLKSLQLTTAELNRSAALIEDKLAQRPLCLNNKPTPKARILFNVLQKYYLQGIQPVIAHHSRMANQLLPPLNQIFTAADKTPALDHYRQRWLSQQAPQGLWQRFQTANQRHTRVWNTLLRQCNLFPDGL